MLSEHLLNLSQVVCGEHYTCGGKTETAESGGQPSIYFPIGDHVNVSRCRSHTNASGVISTSHIVASHITKLSAKFSSNPTISFLR